MPTTEYNLHGRRLASRFPCPKCRHPGSKVIRTGEDDSGIVTRERRCTACGHRFFTAQEPEWVVRSEQIGWVDHKPRYMCQDPADNR